MALGSALLLQLKMWLKPLSHSDCAGLPFGSRGAVPVLASPHAQSSTAILPRPDQKCHLSLSHARPVRTRSYPSH